MRHTILRLLSSFRSSRAERALAREIRSHLQLLEDQHIARGMDAEEARYAALRAFGGVEQVKEHQREARMFRWLASWPMDLKLGGRMLVKYPGLTIVGGLAMAVAICVGLVIFQVVSLFTNPTLPISEGARLVEIRSIDVGRRRPAAATGWRTKSQNAARQHVPAELGVNGFMDTRDVVR